MLSLLLSLVLAQSADHTLVELEDGYVRVETSSYSIEVPKGWKVTPETRWGQRKIAPVGGGELGVMTAPPSPSSWDELYETSLYFITREEKGTATPYKVTRLENGLEAATFAVKDSKGFESRRYVLVKHPEKGLLALSVRIPGPEKEAVWERHFARMVSTAKFK